MAISIYLAAPMMAAIICPQQRGILLLTIHGRSYPTCQKGLVVTTVQYLQLAARSTLLAVILALLAVLVLVLWMFLIPHHYHGRIPHIYAICQRKDVMQQL